MSTPPVAPLPSDDAATITGPGFLVAAFSQRWSAGECSSVEQFLAGQRVDDGVLLELLRTELLLRQQAGHTCSLSEYNRRYPQFSQQLAQLFPPAQGGAFLTQTLLTHPPSPNTAAGPDAGPVAHCGPLQIPGYELRDELGRGGMAVVYRAWQQNPGRLVALKVMFGQASDPLAARFAEEIAAVIALQDGRIVRVYESGTVGHAQWFSMELCTGGSLAQHLQSKPQPAEWSARLVLELAQAMQHAHECKVLHRDLKPGNVLLSQDGSPRISDFGLAQRLEASRITRPGEILGTPAYMPPEQAQGSTANFGPATDVYALGAILYECLTGRPPFLGSDPYSTLYLVIHTDTVAPRTLVPEVPRDLETICLKCLHKEPERRYQSARELADDLQRFLDGHPILARPVGWVERCLKWTRRQPLAAALLGGVIVSVSAGLFGVTSAWLRAEHHRRNAEAGWKAEAERYQQAERQLYVSRIALADRDLRENQHVRGDKQDKTPWALDQLQRCPLALRNWEWYYLQRQVNREPEVVWRGLTGEVRCLLFLPSGERVVSASADGRVRYWDRANGEILQTLEGHQGSVEWLACSPDGEQLASADTGPLGEGGTLIVREAGSGKESYRLTGHTQPISALAWHPGGRYIATGTYDLADPASEVWLWDTKQRQVIRHYAGHPDRVTGVAFDPTGQVLATACHDRRVRLYSLEQNEPQTTFAEHEFPVSAIVFSPDGKLIASAAGRLQADKPSESEVLIWEVGSGRVVHRLQGHTKRVTTLTFTPDGQRLVTGDESGTIKVHVVETGQELVSIPAHQGGVKSVAFSQDGRYLISGGGDRLLKLWQGRD